MKALVLLLSLSILPLTAKRGPDNAPALGAAIPAVSTKTSDGKTSVDLAEPKRLTVLIFGSHT